jgi:hypothetical protein
VTGVSRNCNKRLLGLPTPSTVTAALSRAE